MAMGRPGAIGSTGYNCTYSGDQIKRGCLLFARLFISEALILIPNNFHCLQFWHIYETLVVVRFGDERHGYLSSLEFPLTKLEFAIFKRSRFITIIQFQATFVQPLCNYMQLLLNYRTTLIQHSSNLTQFSKIILLWTIRFEEETGPMT